MLRSRRARSRGAVWKAEVSIWISVERYHRELTSVLTRRLIDDGRMLQAAQIKHTNAAILTTAYEDVDRVGTEPYIVNFLVVRNELRLGRERGNVPYRAGRIDAGGDDEGGIHGVPVKRGQRSGVIRRLGVRKKRQGSELGARTIVTPSRDVVTGVGCSGGVGW